jgi:hypothetical protein
LPWQGFLRPSLTYSSAPDFERQICQFILRGIGMNGRAIFLFGYRSAALEAADRIAESA